MTNEGKIICIILVVIAFAAGLFFGVIIGA